MKRFLGILLACLYLAGCSTASPQPTIPENPYGPEDFARDGEYMTCLAGAYMKGIDVSVWQGDVDWQQVYASGIEFVMIRVGRRTEDTGEISADPRAAEYYEGAKAAGLQIGCYFYSQAISQEEAVEEARFVLDAVSDWELDLPIVFDWENYNPNCRTQFTTGGMLTKCAVAFCETIGEAGYEPMLYFNKDLSQRLDWEQLKDYKRWFAMYNPEMDYPDQVDVWQYSETGSVPGIQGNVDLNIWLYY